jgi:high affinity Mn2+ porin
MFLFKRKILSGLLLASAMMIANAAEPQQKNAANDSDAESWAIHGQLTNVTQWHPAFTSPYSSANSLTSNGRTEETTDLTLYTGLRLWRGAEFWLNSEVDQGFGLSNTLGMAGFPSGEAYKIGANTPYLRLPRAFLRQVIALGGATEKVEASANQLAGANASDNVTLTIGKFSVVDIFDTNRYAHDPRADFLNWSIIDAGTFDYAADAWGYTNGAALEWTQDWWTLRGGFFQLSSVPNGKIAGIHLGQYMLTAEMEERHQWLNHGGKLKLLGFVNHGRMGSYQDALQLANQNASTPDTSLVRHGSSRAGGSLNLEQELANDLGAFARISVNDGSKEAYEFTEINKSLSAGISIKGNRWKRSDDTIGMAFAINGLSSAARNYFAAGGMGILIGDGQLNYAPEKIMEIYYALAVDRHVSFAVDFQHVNNPAYNHDRGPVSIYGVRLHGEF